MLLHTFVCLESEEVFNSTCKYEEFLLLESEHYACIQKLNLCLYYVGLEHYL